LRFLNRFSRAVSKVSPSAIATHSPAGTGQQTKDT